MKNLEIYLDDGTKVFEAIISNHTGIVKVDSNTKMKTLELLVQSVIDWWNKNVGLSGLDIGGHYTE